MNIFFPIGYEKLVELKILFSSSLCNILLRLFLFLESEPILLTSQTGKNDEMLAATVRNAPRGGKKNEWAAVK